MHLKEILFLFIILGLISCNSEQSTSAALETPEAEYKKSPSPTTATRLAQASIEYLQNNPELTKSQKQTVLVRAVAVTKEQKMWPQSAGFLNTIIRQEDNSSEVEKWGTELIEVMKSLRNPQAHESLQLAYLKAFPKNKGSINLENKSAFKDIDQKINDLGQNMFNDSTHQFNEQIATQFIDACEAHALLLSKDPASIDYLHKAGETARSIRSFRKAISIYDWIYEKFKNDSRSSQALFLKAFTYDNDLKDLTTAKELYNEYLSKYPNDDFADDTQFLLKNLGKSDEEILKELSKG